MNFPSRNEDYLQFYTIATKQLIAYIKNNKWASSYFDITKLKNLKDDDLTPILYSSRNDFNTYIEDAYGIVSGYNHLWKDMQNLLHEKEIENWETDAEITKYTEAVQTAARVVDFLTSYYEKANAVTLLVPDGRFNTLPLDLKDILPLLDKLESLNIPSVLVNIEQSKDNYYPTFIKIYRTDYKVKAYEGKCSHIVFDNEKGIVDISEPPEVEKAERGATTLWVADFMETGNTYYSHYKQLFLRASYDDKAAKYTKMSKVNVSIPSSDCQDLYGYVYSTAPEITIQQVFNDKNIRWWKAYKPTDDISRTLVTARLPASWVLSATDKYLLSCAFQAIDAFVNRKTIYKEKPELTRIPKINKDIILIDEDDLDSEGKPYIRTLSDIVAYEETNGTIFHTHHASPRRHWVKSHTRHLANGKETEVTGHWRGKDGKEVIYKLPKRPKSH